MEKIITHGSTFSGIGAPEVAAEMLGWENVFHCEINPFGRKVLDYYFPNAESYEDITKTDFTKWQGRVTVLTGGFPCQPFSYAGKRRGSEDDRYLWPFMLRCIEQVRPRWFVGENVAGITTMEFPNSPTAVGEEADLFGDNKTIYELRQQLVLSEIIESLVGVGYSVQPFVIPACAVNAPHRRDRVFIVARRDDTRDTGRGSSESNAQHDGGRSAEYSSSGRNEMQNNASRTTESERRAAEISSYTPSQRRREIYEQVQSKLADGAEPFGNGRERTSADTSHNGGGGESNAEGEQTPRPNSGQVGESCEHGRVRRFFWSEAGGSLEALLPEQRWRTFPSVSPVCRRHDGFSSDVVRYLTDDVYDTIQEHYTDQDLRDLRKAFSKEEVRQSVGRLYKIPEPQVLLQILLSKEELRQSRQEQGCLSVRSEEVSQGILRKLRKQRPCADSPQGLQLQEQLSRELGISVPTLSHDVALAAVEVSKEVESMRSYVRRESLKAYGNAIVPQVMYEIFRCIDLIEKDSKQ